MAASHLVEWPDAMAAKGNEKVQQRLWQPNLHRPRHKLLNHGDSRDIRTSDPKRGQASNLDIKEMPYFLRVRRQEAFWTKHSSQETQSLIRHGLRTHLPLPSQLSMRENRRSTEQAQLAQEVLQEYLEVGAVKKIPLHEVRHLIPWFVIKKEEKGKNKVALNRRLPRAK